MRWAGFVCILLALSISFGYILEFGDGGKAFANQTASEKCNEEDVQSVYICLGNVVRVVSSLPGNGSTFYKPDGKVVGCPVVAPSQMGAECLQMMMPNYCANETKCGEAIPPQVFPGQNDTPEQTGDIDYYIVEEEEPEEEKTEVVQVAPKPKPLKPTTVKSENAEYIPATSPNVDNASGYIALLALLLGVLAIGVLFMMFRKSLDE